MNYRQIICENDRDIPYLSSVHRLPEIAKYISIDEANFWHYVTTSENVFYYKVYEEDYLVATLHCEISHKTLYISVLVIPEYQNKGLGTSIIQDITV